MLSSWTFGHEDDSIPPIAHGNILPVRSSAIPYDPIFCFPWRHISSGWEGENTFQCCRKSGSCLYLLLCSYEISASNLCNQRHFLVLWAEYFIAHSISCPTNFLDQMCIIELYKTEADWTFPVSCFKPCRFMLLVSRTHHLHINGP